MRNGPLPLAVHEALEPVLGILFIVAPFLLGFDDSTAATATSIVAGVLVLLVGMTTNWRLSLMKVLPLRVHALLDLGLGIALIASPFLFGFSDVAAATIFAVLMGAGLVLASLATRWDHAEDFGRGRSGGAQPAV